MSESIDREIEELVREHGFTRPDRGDLDEYGDKWRAGKPHYSKVDLGFLRGKSMNHPAGSVEMAVENLVKKWEMELTHLPDCEDWTTVETSQFCVQVNGGREVPGPEAAELGSYNMILEGVKKELYNAEEHSWDSSHKLFRGGRVPMGAPGGVLWATQSGLQLASLGSVQWVLRGEKRPRQEGGA